MRLDNYKINLYRRIRLQLITHVTKKLWIMYFYRYLSIYAFHLKRLNKMKHVMHKNQEMYVTTQTHMHHTYSLDHTRFIFLQIANGWISCNKIHYEHLYVLEKKGSKEGEKRERKEI